MHLDISPKTDTKHTVASMPAATVSPKFIQSLNILSMDTLSLLEYVKLASEENPYLEVTQAAPPPLSNHHQTDPMEYSYGEYDTYRHKGTLQAHLLSQASQLKLTCRDKKILNYLIHCVDENGYLTLSNEQLSKSLKADISTIEKNVALLQSLEPLGVGAQRLSEALLLQAKAFGEENTIATRIIKDHLELVGAGAYKKIARLLKVSQAEVFEACALIKKLNPKPGNGFQSSETTRYAVPDVEIAVQDAHLLIHPLNRYGFSVNILDDFNLYENKILNKETLSYIKEKQNQAAALIHSIQTRETTLLKCVELVAYYQKAFLLKQQPYLNPLSLSSLSEILGLSQSTISRTLKDKYVQYDNRIYPVKFFFSPGFFTGGAWVSQHRIMYLILDIIHGEDHSRPFADETIRTALEKMDISLTRRTIVKYRQRLGIPSASKRKYT